MSPDELNGDLKEWSELKETLIKGLSALNYPSGSQQEYTSGGNPPVPNYYPNHQIRALDNAIQALKDKYKNILILVYVYKLNDTEIGKIGECHRNTVKNRISDAKHQLIKSKYWKT